MYDYTLRPRRSACSRGAPVPPGRRVYCSYPCLFRAMRALQYGLEPGGVERIWDEQDGRCAIGRCVFDPEVRTPVIDHDHDDGTVRGLLCRTRNSTVRFFDAALRRGERPRVGHSKQFARRIRRYIAGTPRSGRIGEHAAAWVSSAVT